MNLLRAIRLTKKAHRAGIEASAQSVGGPRSATWSVHLDHGRRIFENGRACELEIFRLRGHKGEKPC